MIWISGKIIRIRIISGLISGYAAVAICCLGIGIGMGVRISPYRSPFPSPCILRFSYILLAGLFLLGKPISYPAIVFSFMIDSLSWKGAGFKPAPSFG